MAKFETQYLGAVPPWPALIKAMTDREARTGYEYRMMLEPGFFSVLVEAELPGGEPIWNYVRGRADTDFVHRRDGYAKAIELFNVGADAMDQWMRKRLASVG